VPPLPRHSRRPATGWRSTRGTTAPADQVCASLPGSGHLVVTGDLTSADSCERVVAEAVAGLGDLDVLVNNAGVYASHPITETSYRDWQRTGRHTLELNLVARRTWPGSWSSTGCAARTVRPAAG